MRGILFSQMEPPIELEGQFHNWYNEEHIPLRLAVDGFEMAQRYEAVEGSPKFLAIYELSDLDALASANYEKIKTAPSQQTTDMLKVVIGFTRFTCKEISDVGNTGATGSFLSVVNFTVPDERLDEFDDWYETEHVPALLKADDWLRVRRYEVLDGDGGTWNRISLHELASLEVLSSSERAAARKGPKRDALASEEWFEKSGRWIYRRIHTFFA